MLKFWNERILNGNSEQSKIGMGEETVILNIFMRGLVKGESKMK